MKRSTPKNRSTTPEKRSASSDILPKPPAGRYCEMEWTEKGASCRTNIPGLFCPRCIEPLPVDVLHACGHPPRFLTS